VQTKQFQRFELLSLASAPKPIMKGPAPVPIEASHCSEISWWAAAVIPPRASTHDAGIYHHGPRLNLMLSSASVTELYWRPASHRLYEDSLSVPPHDQAAKRTGSLKKGDDLLIFFCVLCCEYAMIEAHRDAVIVTLGPTSDENEIGNGECQSSDMAFALGHRTADNPTQMRINTVAVISVVK
jgi:hypothetical protein